MSKLQNLIVVLLFTTTVSTAQLTDVPAQFNEIEGDPEMEKYLREALENFREQMREGIDAINMPKLDPLELQNLDINVNENLALMSLKIQQVSVSSLSLFNITSLKPNLEKLYIAVNLTLPELYVRGNYITDGRLLKIFPVYGSGPFQINATNISIDGKGKLFFSNDTLEMEMLKLDLHWHEIFVSLDNFLGGGDFSEVLQRVIPGVGKDVFLAYKPLIIEKLEAALTKIVNEKLEDPMVKQIIKGIYPDSEDEK